jgi:hypothetical protein
VGDAAAIGAILTAAFSPVPGLWYHVAYTFDDPTKQQALYVNGQQMAAGKGSKSIGYDGQSLLLGRDTKNSLFQATRRDLRFIVSNSRFCCA